MSASRPDWRKLVLMVLVMVPFLMAGPVLAKSSVKPQGEGFSSPEAAVKALVEAARKADSQAILKVLGDNALDLVFSGDTVEGKTEAENFVKHYQEKHLLRKLSESEYELLIGADGWPFPIPVIKVGDKWYFDVEAGREELLNRRIGRNELTAIQVLLAYVNAQLEYASRDRDGDGILEYAQKIRSDPGKKNGLYWPVKPGEEPSPFGPMIAQAAAEGYQASDQPQPYHGYYFKIITRQGKNAPGGAYDYIVNGNMILGFGMIAWPARYGVSGIMTFAVNQEGVIYQCDLGEKTSEIIQKMVKYNPDEHVWRKVSQRDME
jgi:hypothetical protein